MKTLHRLASTVVLLALLVGCDSYLNTSPQTIVTDDDVWGDPALIQNVLADFYDRVPLYQGLDQNGQYQGQSWKWQEFTSYDEALYSGVTAGAEIRNSLVNYPFSSWVSGGNSNAWSLVYDLVRDINLAIDNIEEVFPEGAEKSEILAEMRFVRAHAYFELIKRVGGVPLITSQQIYDFSGDPTSLQHPRSAEEEAYDFIAAELDAVAGELGNEGSQTRANRWAALALKSRAMLYAASIARHNSEMSSPITLPGGEVGIPAARADGYYEQSLDASLEILNEGPFVLSEGADPGDAFHSIFYQDGNPEVILAKAYSAGQGKEHYFAMQAYPRSLRVEQIANWGGAAISPSLNLVENFDHLDGSSGEMRGVGDGTVAGQANWIFYDDPSDIFADKDGRMHGTVIVPGSEFAGRPLDFLAGVYEWNGSEYERISGAIGSTHSDGGPLTGMDGPVPAEVYTSVTGFYHRKYLDPAPDAPTAVGSQNWWVLFRLGEMYMNAAEAAFELGQTGDALEYVNRLRERAGFPANSLTSLDRDKIRSERWAELAFEDHRIWDLRRWRIAHEVWDGTSGSPTANLNTLYPYRVIRPGHATDGTYVYDRIPAQAQGAPRFFRMGNYYSQIPDGVIAGNPQVVRNPFH